MQSMSSATALRWLRLAVVFSLVLHLFNHLTPPSGTYAVSHYFFTYDEGLLRRGFLGEVLSLIWPDPVGHVSILLTAFLITCFGGFCFTAVLQALLPQSQQGLLLVIIALNSFAFAAYLGAPGYLDGVLLSLACLVLLTPVNWGGIALRSVALAVGVLVHEAMLPFFGGLIAFDIWLSAREDTARRWLAVFPLILIAALVIGLYQFANLDAEGFARLHEAMERRAPIELHPHALRVIEQSVMTNSAEFDYFRHNSQLYGFMLGFDGALGLAMAGWLIWLALRILGPASTLTRLGAIMVPLAPLVLNLVAIDAVRFSAMSGFAGFLNLGLICHHRPGAVARLAQVLSWPHALFVLVLNANIFMLALATENTTHRAQFPWALFNHLEWREPLE